MGVAAMGQDCNYQFGYHEIGEKKRYKNPNPRFAMHPHREMEPARRALFLQGKWEMWGPGVQVDYT
jgi:hypothetical protein